MDFVVFLAIGLLLGTLLGLVAGFVFPQARHGALFCFLACVALFWLYCMFYGGGLFDGASILGVCYAIFMRLFYGAFIGSLAPFAYWLAQFLITRIRKPRPPA